MKESLLRQLGTILTVLIILSVFTFGMISFVIAETCYHDYDSDGYGDPTDSMYFDSCDEDPDYVNNGLDCDDNNPDINPGANEVCDGIDNSCSGLMPSEIDNDGDNFVACEIEGTWWGDPSIIGGNDCDDSDYDVYPGATEICDGKDNDCNGQIDDGLQCNAVPTLSEWGMIVLMLLLLMVGMVVIRKRNKV